MPSTATAKAGTFCSTKGQTATTAQQVHLVCEPGSDGRLRWTLVTPGRGEQSLGTASPTH